MSEEWRMVPGTGDLEVSNLGRIRRYLTPEVHPHGYHIIRTGTRKNGFRRFLHRLVAHAFLGEPPLGYEVNHKNSNKQDNRPENLEYVTHRINMLQVIREGRGCLGRRVLTDEQRLEIKDQYERGIPVRQLAKAFQVGIVTIYRYIK